MGESYHLSWINNPASSSQVIGEQGGRTMVSVVVTADDCFGEDYIIDNQPVGAKTHKIVRRPQGSDFQSSQLLMSVLKKCTVCVKRNFQRFPLE